MQVIVIGRELPGARWSGHQRIGVGLQVRADPDGVVPGDAAEARWETEVRLVEGDFRGPAVHGKRGERFLYLSWGDLAPDGFAMFRRAKLVLDRVDPGLVDRADRDGVALVAEVSLTDEKGGPRCARVDPPAVRWRLDRSSGQASGARSL